MPYLRPLLPFLFFWAVLLFSPGFTQLACMNGIAQLTLFALVVLLPTWKTGRMSYVDIGWPLGLAVIGLVTLFIGSGSNVHVIAISVIFLFMGLRMGLGAIKMWRVGHLKNELPRYEYQRLRWERRQIKNVPLMMQSEALSQGLANMSFLALPAFLIASNQGENIHWLEVTGLLIWIAAFAMESVADIQKNNFLKSVRARGLRKQVCNVGLWRYSRHPNYFAEWMVWNALIIAAIPSWMNLYSQQNLIVWLLLGFGLAFVSLIMYTTLVHYTGAKPAEFYSVQKRPEYRNYQSETNIFFPGPVKTGK